MFVDEATIVVRSGSGGHGCVSFRREKYIPRGGPDGGNGGKGGNVYLRATRNLTTLGEMSRKSVYKAEDGGQGEGNKRAGRNGKDLWIEVPVGTVVREITPGQPPREGRLLGDLLEHGSTLFVARGGKGGRGNKSFATPTRQAPREAEDGVGGEERRLFLELKLLAQVGLVGLPNAGKSTLLSRVSAARPKVADYPFSTLAPYLGIAELDGYRQMVFADLPGIIEGAHRGVGLGTDFLRHVERTRVLLHLVSVESGSVDQMVSSYETVDGELRSYGCGIAAKPRIVVASKIDLLPLEEREAVLRDLSTRLGRPILPVSAVTGLGVREVIAAAARLFDEEQERAGQAGEDPAQAR